MVSSGLLGRGLRLQIPDFSPASVGGILMTAMKVQIPTINSYLTHVSRYLHSVERSR